MSKTAHQDHGDIRCVVKCPATPWIIYTFSKSHDPIILLNDIIDKQSLTCIVSPAVYWCQCVNCTPRHWWRIAPTKKFVLSISFLIGQHDACALFSSPMAAVMLVASRCAPRRFISHVANRFQLARNKVMSKLWRRMAFNVQLFMSHWTQRISCNWPCIL